MKKILKEVLEGNRALQNSDLQIQNFGNLSVKFKDKLYIKPSGVNLKKISFSDISVVRIIDCKHVGGKKPSVDTPIHAELYKKFNQIKSIVHTHSLYASSWAQSLKSIECLGTTHADYFFGKIPITRKLKKVEIQKNYELNLAKSIIEKISYEKLDIKKTPGILLANHGVFSWGDNINDALNNAEIIEFIAHLGFNAKIINPKIKQINRTLHSKHFKRKWGNKAYYGQ